MTSVSVRQDNIAEKMQIQIFGLIDGDTVAGNKRREGYDAFGPNNIPIECKTSSKGSDNYSTSARLSPNYVEKMSRADWVCSQTISDALGRFAGFKKHTVILKEMMAGYWDNWRAHFTLVEQENAFVAKVLSHPKVASIFIDEIQELNEKNLYLVKVGIRKQKYRVHLRQIIMDRLEHGKTLNDPKLTAADVAKYGKTLNSPDELNKILTLRSYDV